MLEESWIGRLNEERVGDEKDEDVLKRRQQGKFKLQVFGGKSEPELKLPNEVALNFYASPPFGFKLLSQLVPANSCPLERAQSSSLIGQLICLVNAS